MKCEIYRSSLKSGAYLYIEKKDDFSRVPAALLEMLGRLDHVMHLELKPERKLASENPAEVRLQLAEQGFYLQLPPAVHEQD